MTVQRYKMPNVGERVVEPSGELTPPFHRYLGGLEKVSGRVAANLPAGSSTDELLAALKAARLMEPD